MFSAISKLKDSIGNWLNPWVRFFSPMPNWKERYISFRSGQTAWPVPGRPDANATIPWPMEWIPHLPVAADFPDAQAAKRGFLFVETQCSETGKKCPVGVGVCCVRCGIVLHETAANMQTGFSAPSCSRCYRIVNRWT
jgi:hypothetical protein